MVKVRQNITSLKLADQLLSESEERHRVLFERMPEGCAINESITDADGHFVDFRTLEANAAYEHHLGIKPQGVIGKNNSEVIPGSDKQMLAVFEAAMVTGAPQSLEYYSQRLHRHLRVRAFPGEQGKFVSLFEDITERIADAGLLVAAHKAADTANRAKSVFLHNMSHEIRTPLNGILGFAQLLREEILSPRLTEYVNAISTSGAVLAHLIDDLLDLSKIEADRMVIEHCAFDVRKKLTNALLLLRERADEKMITLQLNVSSDVPSMLIGDGRRIAQVALNLAGNAVKFTERGGVTVSVNVEEHDTDTVMLDISVADTGIGMSAEAMLNIFEPFTQAEASTTRQFGGTGLGLSICRQLTDLMGGSLTCESVVGRGSVFRARLPLLQTEASATEVATDDRAAPASQWIGPAIRVLLVEDHHISQQLGTTVLRKMGHTVVLAANGTEALQALNQSRFDLVLMDIQMPVMNGLVALSVLRAHEEVTREHALVIAVTAFAMTGDAERFLAAGFDGYVSKPLQVFKLVAEMQRVLATSSSHTESSQ